MGTKSNKVVFKPYIQNQIQLSPPILDDLVDAKHPCRIVNEVIEKIDIRPVNRKYKGEGLPVIIPVYYQRCWYMVI
jgi:hypothetical protein